jgi:hypothetical protein
LTGRRGREKNFPANRKLRKLLRAIENVLKPVVKKNDYAQLFGRLSCDHHFLGAFSVY